MRPNIVANIKTSNIFFFCESLKQLISLNFVQIGESFSLNPLENAYRHISQKFYNFFRNMATFGYEIFIITAPSLIKVFYALYAGSYACRDRILEKETCKLILYF